MKKAKAFVLIVVLIALTLLTLFSSWPPQPRLVIVDRVEVIKDNNVTFRPSIVELKEKAHQEFMEKRRQLYQSRHKKILKTCQTLTPQPIKYSKKYLIYNKKKKIAYCEIPKAASSTWTRNFMIWGGFTPAKHNHLMASKRMPWPLDLSPAEALQNMTSIVIVRHPLSRLVSTFHSKFIRMGLTKWNTARLYVIKYFRYSEAEDSEYPSPDEYLRFVLSTLGFKYRGPLGRMPRPLKPDAHWMPQSQICPFCSINFTIYSHMEQLHMDSNFFVQESGLEQSRFKLLTRDNPSTNSRNTTNLELDFWSKVPPNTVQAIIQAYNTDFLMFGYSVKGYFKRLKLDHLFNLY